MTFRAALTLSFQFSGIFGLGNDIVMLKYFARNVTASAL